MDPEAKLAELKACGGSVLIATAADTGGHEWPARPKADYRIEAELLAFFDSQR